MHDAWCPCVVLPTKYINHRPNVAGHFNSAQNIIFHFATMTLCPRCSLTNSLTSEFAYILQHKTPEITVRKVPLENIISRRQEREVRVNRREHCVSNGNFIYLTIRERGSSSRREREQNKKEANGMIWCMLYVLCVCVGQLSKQNKINNKRTPVRCWMFHVFLLRNIVFVSGFLFYWTCPIGPQIYLTVHTHTPPTYPTYARRCISTWLCTYLYRHFSSPQVFLFFFFCLIILFISFWKNILVKQQFRTLDKYVMFDRFSNSNAHTNTNTVNSAYNVEREESPVDPLANETPLVCRLSGRK